MTDPIRSDDDTARALAAYDLHHNNIVGRTKLWLLVLAALLIYGVSWRLAELD